MTAREAITLVPALRCARPGSGFLLWEKLYFAIAKNYKYSKIKEEEGSYILDSITDKEDWDLVQKAIQELSE